MQKTTLTGLIYPIWLKNLGEVINIDETNQKNADKILGDIYKAIQKVDLESAFVHDITDAESIKRRLHRIRIMIGQKFAPNSNSDIVKEWEGCVQSNLNMTRCELLCSIDPRKSNKSISDIVDEIPEFRKIGVDILVALERKYKIPPALYSVEQVRRIGELRREFNHSIIRCLDKDEMKYWLNERCREIDSMMEDYRPPKYNLGSYGQYITYWMFAQRHPELIPEKQLKYLTEKELIDVSNRAINDIREEDIKFQGNRKVFPLSNTKHDISTYRDSIIDIVLRVLIA